MTRTLLAFCLLAFLATSLALAGSPDTAAAVPTADQGPPPSAIPTMTLVWLAMGGSALLLTLALLAFGLRPRPKG
ncbi:MAG: hypothetical protein AB7K09_10985 [Planctomycetota bacterium]